MDEIEKLIKELEAHHPENEDQFRRLIDDWLRVSFPVASEGQQALIGAMARKLQALGPAYCRRVATREQQNAIRRALGYTRPPKDDETTAMFLRFFAAAGALVGQYDPKAVGVYTAGLWQTFYAKLPADVREIVDRLQIIYRQEAEGKLVKDVDGRGRQN